jgi:hypothetical protein
MLYREGTAATALLVVTTAVAATTDVNVKVPSQNWWRVTVVQNRFFRGVCSLLRFGSPCILCSRLAITTCKYAKQRIRAGVRSFHLALSLCRFTVHCCALLTYPLATFHCLPMQPLEPLQVLTWVIMVAIVAQFYAVIVPALAVSRIAQLNSTEQ